MAPYRPANYGVVAPALLRFLCWLLALCPHEEESDVVHFDAVAANGSVRRGSGTGDSGGCMGTLVCAGTMQARVGNGMEGEGRLLTT